MNKAIEKVPERESADEHFHSGRFAKRYQFWIEHQASVDLVRTVRKLVSKNAIVLDAGCGDGITSVALANVVGRVVGLDLSRKMLDLARIKTRQAKLTNIDFFQGDLRHIGVQPYSFDLVLCNFALHHTPVELTLPQLAEAVKPGGWLLVQEPTCPVCGMFRPIWYRLRGLRIAAAATHLHGLKVGWSVAQFHQSSEWLDHQLADRHWNQETWVEAASRVLPDATIRQSPDKASISILWQRAPGNRITARSFQQSAGRTQVKHKYPHPPPADFRPFPRSALGESVVDRFEKQVAEYAERLALVSSSLSYTYAELNSAANRLARTLLAVSESDCSPVAVLMDQEEPIIPAILGILKTGKPYVAIDPLDASQRRQRVMTKAGVQTIVTTSARISELDELGASGIRTMIWEESRTKSDDNPGLILKPETTAAVFFTSGSTGEPKGVSRDHRQILHSTWLNTNTYFVSASDRQSLLYFPGFTASVPSIYDTLLNGATLFSLSPGRMSPGELLGWLADNRVSHFAVPAGLWRELIGSLDQPAELPHLRLVTIAGQTLYAKDILEFQEKFGRYAVLLYVLAMTEAGAVTQAYIDRTSKIGDGPVPVGYPLPDKHVEIVDEHCRPLPSGEIGTVWISSPYLSLGYWQDPEKTTQVFVENADGSGSRTFRTSDRGCVHPDGCVEFFGRNDSIIKLRGYRIDTEAIETSLNAHPDVSQAAVVVRHRSYGDPYLAAYLTCTTKEAPSSQTLRDHIIQTLPHFMVPDRFVWIEKMVLTTSGKIDRQALARLFTPRPLQDEDFIAPRNPTEVSLAVIWEELLEVDQIGVRDSFVDLGGDSLLAMRMAQLVERKLKIKLPAEFFSKSTIEELSRLILEHQEKGKISQPITLKGVSSETAYQFSELLNKSKPLKLYNPVKTLRRIIRTGPLWGNHALPFSAGVRLQRVLAVQTWLIKRIYAKNIVWLQRWQTELGDESNRDHLGIHLMANTWIRWRTIALSRPEMFDAGVRISEKHKVWLASTEGRQGTVLLVPHTGWIMFALEYFARMSGRPTSCVFIDLSIENSGDSNRWEAQQVKSRSSQLWQAQNVLQRGGVVLIAGDGIQGNQWVDVNLCGRRRSFQTGAAWLAVMNDAQYVPVFATFTLDGVLDIEISSPLSSKSLSDEGRIVELTREYGRLYAQRWPVIFPSVSWTHLEYNFNLPKIETLAD
jgi:amino acid adenylation domain-containing protein